MDFLAAGISVRIREQVYKAPPSLPRILALPDEQELFLGPFARAGVNRDAPLLHTPATVEASHVFAVVVADDNGPLDMIELLAQRFVVKPVPAID